MKEDEGLGLGSTLVALILLFLFFGSMQINNKFVELQESYDDLDRALDNFHEYLVWSQDKIIAAPVIIENFDCDDDSQIATIIMELGYESILEGLEDYKILD